MKNPTLSHQNNKGPISHSCLKRLVTYKDTLTTCKNIGFTKIFSSYLADKMGITGSQVRKDLSQCRINGKKRGGYQIDSLLTQINSFIRKEDTQEVILVGAGNLGSALMKYHGFEKEKISIAAAFDIDPSKYNKKCGFPVLPIEQMGAFVKEHRISIGIIAVPGSVAQQVLNMMAAAGIRGVLNFAHCWLSSPDASVIVNNVNLAQELECLIYQVGTRIENEHKSFLQP